MPRRFIAFFICLCFIFTSFQSLHAQEFNINLLPVPGTMVNPSKSFAPISLKGLVVNPQKPLEFQFIVDAGSDVSLRGATATKQSQQEQLKVETNRLIKYFLTGLTIPENDLWVNLSPYEKDRITTEWLGRTELGRDLLAQDYILKQLTASLIYPEKDLGKEFWNKIYKKAQEKLGTPNVPVNTFNKVWILPNEAQVFENGNAVYVTKATLKVMLDEDYVARSKTTVSSRGPQGRGDLLKNNNDNVNQVLRDIIIPEIEKEINEGKNFAPLRQIYQALILAKWYKETVKNALFEAVYTDRNRTNGINLNDLTLKQQIYERYLQAYKKGVFNYVSAEGGSVFGGKDAAPRKYFSGGLIPMPSTLNKDGAMRSVKTQEGLSVVMVDLNAISNFPNNRIKSLLVNDKAMKVTKVAVLISVLTVLGGLSTYLMQEPKIPIYDENGKLIIVSEIIGNTLAPLEDRGVTLMFKKMDYENGKNRIVFHMRFNQTIPFGIIFAEGRDKSGTNVSLVTKFMQEDGGSKLKLITTYTQPHIPETPQLKPEISVVPYKFYSGESIEIAIPAQEMLHRVNIILSRPRQGATQFNVFVGDAHFPDFMRNYDRHRLMWENPAMASKRISRNLSAIVALSLTSSFAHAGSYERGIVAILEDIEKHPWITFGIVAVCGISIYTISNLISDYLLKRKENRYKRLAQKNSFIFQKLVNDVPPGYTYSKFWKIYDLMRQAIKFHKRGFEFEIVYQRGDPRLSEKKEHVISSAPWAGNQDIERIPSFSKPYVITGVTSFQDTGMQGGQDVWFDAMVYSVDFFHFPHEKIRIIKGNRLQSSKLAERINIDETLEKIKHERPNFKLDSAMLGLERFSNMERVDNLKLTLADSMFIYSNAWNNQYPYVRQWGIHGLGKLEMKDLLFEMLKDNDVSYLAASILSKLGDKSKEVLLRLDVVNKLSLRKPQDAIGDLRNFQEEAYRYALEGYDFNVIFRPAIIEYQYFGRVQGGQDVADPVVIEQEVLHIDRGDKFQNSAMLHSRVQEYSVKSLTNGGIDLNTINFNREGKRIVIKFDPTMLNDLIKNDFGGFQPIIKSIELIQSPLPLLGVAPRSEEAFG